MLAGVWCPYTLKGKTRPQSVATRTLSSELEKLASNHNSRFELNILGTFGSQFFPSVTYISSSGKPSDHPPTLPETSIEKLALTFKQCFFFHTLTYLLAVYPKQLQAPGDKHPTGLVFLRPSVNT